MWATATVSGRAVAPGVAARSVATSSTFSSPAWAGASTMAPDPGSSAAADGTAAAEPALRAPADARRRDDQRGDGDRGQPQQVRPPLGGASSGASAGSSRVAPSVRPAWAAVRRVRVSSIRLTRVVASTAASSAVGVPLVVPVRSAVRSPRGRSGACVRSPAARSLPCARPTGSAERGLPLPPGCGLRALTRLRRRPGLRRRPFVACVRSLAAAPDLRSRGPTACVPLVGCGAGPGPALARADGLRALSRRRIEVRPVRGPVRAVRPAARLRRGAWPALASSLHPFARCGVGSEPALAPADGMRPVARICGGVWSAASGRRLRALARCGVEVLPALGPAIAVRPVARLGGGVWPALTSGCRPRTRLREGAGFRPRALRPAVLAGARIRCGAGLAVTPAVRPCGRRCLLVRTAIAPPGPGRCSRPACVGWPFGREGGRPFGRAAARPLGGGGAGGPPFEPELSSLVRPVPRRRRVGRSPGVGQADRSGRAPEADCSSAASDGRQAGGPVPVLVPPAFPGRSRGAPRPSGGPDPRPGRAGQRNPRAAEADLPDSRAGGAGSPSRRAGEARLFHTRAARAGRPDRYAGPSRPGAGAGRSSGRCGGPGAIDPLGSLGGRIAARLPPRVARLSSAARRRAARPARERVGAGQPEPGEDVVGPGRGRRAPGSIRTVRHATSPRRTRQRAGEIATISLPPPLTRTSLRTPSNPITRGSRPGVAG